MQFQCFNHICMGGTFDHMHSGHLLLLTQAAILTKKSMLIGITGDALLKKKSYADILQPYVERQASVIHFLKRFCGDKITINCFELNDPAGLSATQPELDAIILTREVERGGKIINDAREANGLNQVPLVFVDMILVSDQDCEKFSNKMSSTLIRNHIANK